MTNLKEDLEQIDRFAEARIKEANMPGLVIAITDRGTPAKTSEIIKTEPTSNPSPIQFIWG